MGLAAECWWVELRGRTPRAWRRTLRHASVLAPGITWDSSGASDLIFVAVADLRVAHMLAAGDEWQSERLLLSARRALLSMSTEEFAHEWGIPHSPTARV